MTGKKAAKKDARSGSHGKRKWSAAETTETQAVKAPRGGPAHQRTDYDAIDDATMLATTNIVVVPGEEANVVACGHVAPGAGAFTNEGFLATGLTARKDLKDRCVVQRRSGSSNGATGGVVSIDGRKCGVNFAFAACS